ncbi:MAG: PLP-dependent transferase [Firmicutes bacterium]|nr:PLP-dependent transferase [Bacillota bacterium]
MANYLSITDEQKKHMFDNLGVKNLDDLFCDIPKNLWLRKLNIAPGVSEQEAFEMIEKLANANQTYDIILRGAGAYHHYIPPVVKRLSNKLTPNAMHALELEKMLCELTGLENTSIAFSSGAAASAEGILMCEENIKKSVVIPTNINPQTLHLIKTSLEYRKFNIIELAHKEGFFDYDALKELLNTQKDNISCVYFEEVNYFGLIEDVEEIARLAKASDVKIIMSVHPIASAVLKAPSEYGVDIVVGSLQSLGLSLNYGGAYLGFVSCNDKDKLLPHSIISRNALIASLYLAAMGPRGLIDVAISCASLAHYAAENFVFKAGASLKYSIIQSGQVTKGEFFNEFVTVHKSKAANILRKLEKEGILGGLELDKHEILWCFSEMTTKEEIDKVVEIVRRA